MAPWVIAWQQRFEQISEAVEALRQLTQLLPRHRQLNAAAVEHAAACGAALQPPAEVHEGDSHVVGVAFLRSRMILELLAGLVKAGDATAAELALLAQ